MAPKKDAAELFNKIIQESRERKKREERLNAMLGSGRRSSAPGNANLRKATEGGSLASRVGISKAIQKPGSPFGRPSTNPPQTRAQANGASLRFHSRPLPRTASDSRLDRRARALEDAVMSDSPSTSRSQFNVRGGQANGSGFSIRGKAVPEPITVMCQNLAAGTTAADMDAVIQPIVGDVQCKIISAHPTVICEMLFADRSAAEKVVEMFNNKMADGRKLYVYINDSTNAPIASNAPPPSGPRADRDRDDRRRQEDDDVMEVEDDRRRYDEERKYDEERRRRGEPDYQDGRFGFREPRQYRDARPAGPRTGQRLYSDDMMGRRGPGRFGR